MSRRPGGRPHGQIRQSQLLTSFGPGSMLDLPNHSVLVGGLDTWSTGGETIIEPRLVEKLKLLFDPPLQSLSLFSPPPDLDDPTAAQTGITAWQFPEWFITQDVDAEAAKDGVRARRLVHRRMLTKGRFIDDAQKKQNVVPVRFVRACRAGHIGDLDWYTFTHNTETECRRPLWMEERGTSGDIAEIFIRCECGAVRALAEAVGFATRALGHCDGSRPWLGPYRQVMGRILNKAAQDYLEFRFGSTEMRPRKQQPKPKPGTFSFFQTDPDLRKKVERAAIRFVKASYMKANWRVKSVEHEHVGYDLHCTKGDLVECVEVKGSTGAEQQFTITANEMGKAQTDNRFVLYVITNALNRPVSHRYSGSQLMSRFDIQPTQYRAKLK